MSDNSFYEYAVQSRTYFDEDSWAVQRGVREVGWSEWEEFQSETARAKKSNTYSTVGVARSIAAGLRQSKSRFGYEKEARVMKRLVTVGEWEVV